MLLYLEVQRHLLLLPVEEYYSIEWMLNKCTTQTKHYPGLPEVEGEDALKRQGPPAQLLRLGENPSALSGAKKAQKASAVKTPPRGDDKEKRRPKVLRFCLGEKEGRLPAKPSQLPPSRWCVMAISWVSSKPTLRKYLHTYQLTGEKERTHKASSYRQDRPVNFDFVDLTSGSLS